MISKQSHFWGIFYYLSPPPLLSSPMFLMLNYLLSWNSKEIHLKNNLFVTLKTIHVSERIVYLCGGDDVNDFVCTYYYYYCSKQQLIVNRSVWYSYIHIDAKKSLTHKSENCFLIIFCLQCMYILCGWFEMLTIIIISNFWSVQQVIFKRASDNARERVLTNPIS